MELLLGILFISFVLIILDEDIIIKDKNKKSELNLTEKIKDLINKIIKKM